MITPIVGCAAGMDVHRRQVTCTVIKRISDTDLTQQTREFRSTTRALEGMARWLKEQGVDVAVMESTGVYWRAPFAAMEDAGVLTLVVNAYHIKNVPGRKTDVADSEWLAELAMCGLLRPSFIPGRDLRDLRGLTRYRQKLVKIGAAEKTRLHKLLDSCGVCLGTVASDINGMSARRMIEALLHSERPLQEVAQLGHRLRATTDEIVEALQGQIGDRHRDALVTLLAHIDWVAVEVSRLDGVIVSAMDAYEKQWMLLQTVPGINEISAAMLLAEIGADMTRFESKDRLCSWAGMCPGNNESAGKRRSGRTRKGNRYVRSLLCEVAHSASRTESQFRVLYRGLAIRRGRKRALVAVGHKVLEVVFSVLSNGKPYYDPAVDRELLMAKRNAPRWINALERLGLTVVGKDAADQVAVESQATPTVPA